MIGLGGRGGVEGNLNMEDVEDAAVIAPEKAVVVDGADTGSSSDMKCAPSRALNSSRVLDVGIDIGPDCNEG